MIDQIGSIKGTFTELASKKKYIRTLGFTVYKSSSCTDSLRDKYIFQLIGGSTGYESFYLSPRNIMDFLIEENYWCACSGTMNSWDRLIISAKDMRKAITKSMIWILVNEGLIEK